MYKQNLALNKLEWLIRHKTQSNQTNIVSPCHHEKMFIMVRH